MSACPYLSPLSDYPYPTLSYLLFLLLNFAMFVPPPPSDVNTRYFMGWSFALLPALTFSIFSMMPCRTLTRLIPFPSYPLSSRHFSEHSACFPGNWERWPPTRTISFHFFLFSPPNTPPFFPPFSSSPDTGYLTHCHLLGTIRPYVPYFLFFCQPHRHLITFFH